MNFYYVKGKSHLDLTGNLILSKNNQLITAAAISAAPKVHKARYCMLGSLTRWQKVRATFMVLAFIWGK